MKRTGQILVGISGWTYAPWRSTFYPNSLPQKSELQYASTQLPTIEINGSFYSLQKPKSYIHWYDQTPKDFIFSLKAPRYITHIRRLRDIQAPIANFFLSGPLALKEKLGPILWQFPPNFQFNPDLFAPFLASLPHTTSAAAKLLKHTDSHVKDRTYSKIDHDRPLRHAVEIRHDSFAVKPFVDLLRKHNVAMVIADTAGKWPQIFDLTSDFAYLRLHGAEELYASGYTDQALNDWSKKIRTLASGKNAPNEKLHSTPAKTRTARDVYVYFDNDIKIKSPFDAARLAVKLGLRDHPLEAPQ